MLAVFRKVASSVTKARNPLIVCRWSSEVALIPSQTALSKINEDALSKINEDALKICQLLITNPTADVDSLLNPTAIPLSPTLIHQVLKNLSNAGVLAHSFFRWSQTKSRFAPDTDAYNVLIDSLGKIKQFRLIWDLVDEMRKKSALSKRTFVFISRRYARAKNTEQAIWAYRRMEHFGLRMNLSDLNKLMDLLVKSRCYEAAHKVFDRMPVRDAKSYSILLEGWGKSKDLIKMEWTHKEMLANGYELDAIAYGVLILGYCKMREFDKAVCFFEEMQRKKITPTPHVYCILISGLGYEKRLNDAVYFFRLAKESGLFYEAPTFNAVIGAYCASRKFEEAYAIAEEMRGYKIGPNSRTYDVILHHLVKEGRFGEAWSGFRSMKEEKIEVGVSTYEVMLRMFCKEMKLDMAVDLWKEMKMSGVVPGKHMFFVLIDCLWRGGRFDDACGCFEEMLEVGIRPSARVFGDLKQAMLKKGMKESVTMLSQKVRDSKKSR